MQRAIKLSVKPTWNEIEKARIESLQFLQSHGFSGDSIHSLTMVITELIENSIKYGYFDLRKDRVKVNISLDETNVTIEVSNPVTETTTDHLRRLDKTIQWIRGYQDPFEAYIERLKEVAKKPLKDEESGLGLVRIAYEGNGILDFFVSDDDLLNVSTVSNIRELRGEHHAQKGITYQ